MQLGVGMTLPGLDKGLRGMCDQELRKIQVPWRLSKVKRSKGALPSDWEGGCTGLDGSGVQCGSTYRRRSTG